MSRTLGAKNLPKASVVQMNADVELWREAAKEAETLVPHMFPYMQFYNTLESVNPNTIWGHAVHEFLKNPTIPHFCQLVSELRSQYMDSPENMAKILGPECFAHFEKIAKS